MTNQKIKIADQIYKLVIDGVLFQDYARINQAEQLAIENEIFMEFDEDRIYVEDDFVLVPKGTF